MLVECKAVNDFRVVVISWWNHQSGNYYTVDVLKILYGYYPADKKHYIFNYYILLGKRLQRLEVKTLNLSQFLDFVDNKIIL